MKKVRIILFLIAGFFLALIVGIFLSLWISLNIKIQKDAVFEIKKGQGIKEVATNLKNEEIVKSPFAFTLYVYLKKRYLQNGIYNIKKGEKVWQIIKKFHEGKVSENIITIPEGWRVTQIDEALASKKIIKAGEFTKIASASEGSLFPDTYRIPLGYSADQIKDLMLNNFETRTKNLKINREQIILASIVEREAKVDEDRSKIAGVYLNRLEIGMALQADPTIQYAKGSWAPILKSDYKNFQSPYNTYLFKGLPPGPISNPGLKSIEAVLNPASHDYFFFFHKSDGQAVFSKTYDEHLANIAKFK